MRSLVISPICPLNNALLLDWWHVENQSSFTVSTNKNEKLIAMLSPGCHGSFAVHRTTNRRQSYLISECYHPKPLPHSNCPAFRRPSSVLIFLQTFAPKQRRLCNSSLFNKFASFLALSPAVHHSLCPSKLAHRIHIRCCLNIEFQKSLRKENP